jgi:hypothetical protein
MELSEGFFLLDGGFPQFSFIPDIQPFLPNYIS